MCRTSALILSVSTALAVVGLAARADDGPNPARRPAAPKRATVARPSLNEAERETEALAFVRLNHPELATLLAELKPMRPDEYRRAILELDQVRQSLDHLKTANPRRYEVMLDSWKARSRAELLAARLASAPGSELESQLRAAIEAQVESELKSQRLEKEQLEKRLKSLTESIERLESNRETQVEARFQTLRKKGLRARRQGETRPAPVPEKPARTKGASKA